MGKVEFKEFVKKNPSLVKFVKKNEMTWQKFYEMYDMYGEDKEIWKDYLNIPAVAAATTTGFSLSEFFQFLKKMNLDEIQDGLNNVSRVVSVFQDLGNNKQTEQKPTYKPRPIYKHFED